MGVGSRGEAGSETRRRKLCLEGVKFGTCRELEERKAQSQVWELDYEKRKLGFYTFQVTTGSEVVQWQTVRCIED